MVVFKVKADLRAQGVNETHFERCCLFRLNSLGPMYNKGTTRLRTGAIVGEYMRCDVRKLVFGVSEQV